VKKKSVSKKTPQTKTEKDGGASNGVGLAADIQQVAEALSRLRNPTVRYFLAMLVDALAEDIAHLEAGHPPALFTKSPRERPAGMPQNKPKAFQLCREGAPGQLVQAKTGIRRRRSGSS
jgi:hypothetical protein